MRASTALLISRGIGMAPQSAHVGSLLSAGPAFGRSAVVGEFTMDADDVAGAEAQAAAAVSMANEMARRARRTI